MEQTVVLNMDVEQNVAQAADDMTLVNVKIAKELVVRRGIEFELAEVKTNLAEVAEDLSQAEEIKGQVLNLEFFGNGFSS